jgi:Flp pilus assembly protein CpaB
MSNEIIAMLTVVGVVVVVFGGIAYLLPYIKDKGVDMSNLVNKAEQVLNGVDSVVSVADTILPNNPTVNFIKTIDKYAKLAVGQAEQLYIKSQLPADQRNAQAKETINLVLKNLNIEVTPDIQKIIDGAIEAEVLALGHKSKTEQEKETERISLITQNQQLQQVNSQLQNKLNQIQQTVIQG